jgi:hypothetical protein
MSLRLRRSARAKTESKFNVGDVVEVSLRVDVGLSWLCWGAGGAAQTERQAGGGCNGQRARVETKEPNPNPKPQRAERSRIFGTFPGPFPPHAGTLFRRWVETS